MIITSTQNPLIKQVIGLRKGGRRRPDDFILIDGVREISRAVQAGVKIEKVFFCGPFPKELRVERSHLVEVSRAVLEKLSYGQRDGQALALAQAPQRPLALLKLSGNPLLVVLESVEKPGNLGAIVRSCDGAGVEAVLVCNPKTDIFNANAVRASTGTVFSLPVIAASNDEVGAYLDRHNIVCAAALPGDGKLYTRADLTGPLAIIFGSEDKGLSPFWQRRCRQKLTIPMLGRADSLNVSVSAAVLVYEARRQRS